MAGQAAGAMTPSEQPVAGAAAGRRWMDAGWTPWERILRGCPVLPMDEDLAKTDKKIYRGHIRGGGVGCLALLANFVANHFL